MTSEFHRNTKLWSIKCIQISVYNSRIFKKLFPLLFLSSVWNIFFFLLQKFHGFKSTKLFLKTETIGRQTYEKVIQNIVNGNVFKSFRE